MKLISTKKKILFDGGQEELFSTTFKVLCPSCSMLLDLNPMLLKNCSGLDKDIIDFVGPKIKSLKSINLGDDTFYKVDGLPLKYEFLSCEGCDNSYLFLLGVGEYQPARYKLLLVALVAGLFI